MRALSPTNSVGDPSAEDLLKDVHTLSETSLCYEVKALGSIVQMVKLKLGRHLGNC